MQNYIIRTEDFKDELIEKYFVETKNDREIIENLKSEHQMLLIGSRGVGKTMLLKKAEIELNKEYPEKKFLPVFMSFVKGILVNNSLNENYFRYWMLSKILNQFRNSLLFKEIITPANNPFEMLFNKNNTSNNSLDKLIEVLEESWHKKNELSQEQIIEILNIDEKNFKFIDETDAIKNLIEQFCKNYSIQKVILLFDEACHNFIPEQQRIFFSMIRDLRSPYICCKAAVYPGITYYGTLQKFHDILVKKVERNISDKDYINNMRNIVEKQSTETVFKSFSNRGKELDALIICSSGNPRLLLKSLEVASQNFKGLKTADVNKTITEFYRANIWEEHSKLANTYKGHKELIEWSRNFLENDVIPETLRKNIERKPQQSAFFAIQRESSERVKNAIRILEYTGIIQLHTESTKVKTNIYDRYQINLGVIIASDQTNLSVDRCAELFNNLSIKLYTEFGQNSPSFTSLLTNPLISESLDVSNIAIESILNTSIDFLDITPKQKIYIKEIGIFKIKDILEKTSVELMKARQIGPRRSSSIYECAYNAAIEYISG